MNEYKWKVLSIVNNGDLIISAHYYLSATDGENNVETEGNHFFSGKEIKISFSELREQIIINWIVDETTKDEVCSIKSNLDNQLEALKSQKSSGLPWLANTFTPEI